MRGESALRPYPCPLFKIFFYILIQKRAYFMLHAVFKGSQCILRAVLCLQTTTYLKPRLSSAQQKKSVDFHAVILHFYQTRQIYISVTVTRLTCLICSVCRRNISWAFFVCVCFPNVFKPASKQRLLIFLNAYCI